MSKSCMPRLLASAPQKTAHVSNANKVTEFTTLASWYTKHKTQCENAPTVIMGSRANDARS